MIAKILDELGRWNLRTDCENNLQADIAYLLGSMGIEFRREVALNSKDRIDFVAGKIGIEAKVDGSHDQVLRQLSRYAQSDSIESILLVTRRSVHRRMDGTELNGKKIYVFWVNSL